MIIVAIIILIVVLVSTVVIVITVRIAVGATLQEIIWPKLSGEARTFDGEFRV